MTAVGITGQKHAFLPLDAAGRPLCKAVLWCDGRATAESEQAEDAIHLLAGHVKGMNPIHLAIVPGAPRVPLTVSRTS